MIDLLRNEKDGVVYYTSPIIDTPHAFTTRYGGVSTIPHLSTMNMGFDLGDQLDNVKQNYKIIADTVGLSHDFVHTKQVHGKKVITCDYSDVGFTYECDGFVTDKKGITLCIRTADCVPILFSYKNKVIGACHAGWRGTAQKIQIETIDKMCNLGALISDIKVAVGAAIHQCCYNVGADFCKEIENSLGSDIATKTIKYIDGTPYADIVAMNVLLLKEYGIKDENISVSSHCTSCECDTFFSHRAMNGKRGVMASMICI